VIGDLIAHWVVLSLNYILLATGLTLCISIMRIINFAHGHLYMAGAYIFYYFINMVKLPYGVAFLLTMAVVGGLGIIIEMKLYRPLSSRMNAQIVLMIGLIMVLEGLAATIFGTENKDIPPILSGTVSLGVTNVSAERVTVAGTSLLVIAVLFYFVKYTRLGKALRGTAQDRYAASLMGINVNSVSSITMGIGCALAALAGIQIGAVYFISPFIGYSAIITALLVVILGGMGSILGACVGAFIIGFINTFGSIWVGGFAHLLSFGVAFLILLIKPTGLWGISFEIRE